VKAVALVGSAEPHASLALDGAELLGSFGSSWRRNWMTGPPYIHNISWLLWRVERYQVWFPSVAQILHTKKHQSSKSSFAILLTLKKKNSAAVVAKLYRADDVTHTNLENVEPVSDADLTIGVT
jgi:hypothetical protein